MCVCVCVCVCVLRLKGGSSWDRGTEWKAGVDWTELEGSTERLVLAGPREGKAVDPMAVTRGRGKGLGGVRGGQCNI